ncbi:hypothetical protein [Sphingomonas sp. RS2018]
MAKSTGGWAPTAKAAVRASAAAGEELRVVRGGRDRIVQKKPTDRRVPTASLRRFFAALGETCNVRHASDVSGVNLTTLYHKRRTDPQFAATWREALATGYERIEEELLRLTLATLAGERPSLFDPGEVINPASGLPTKANGSPDVQLALVLLNRHRATVEGTARPNAHSKRSTPEETDAYLRKQLDALAKRLRAVGK